MVLERPLWAQRGTAPSFGVMCRICFYSETCRVSCKKAFKRVFLLCLVRWITNSPSHNFCKGKIYFYFSFPEVVASKQSSSLASVGIFVCTFTLKRGPAREGRGVFGGRGGNFLRVIYFEPDDHFMEGRREDCNIESVTGRCSWGAVVRAVWMQKEGRTYALTAQDLWGLLPLQRTLTAPFGAANSLWIY